jgi:hypothetical protein
MEKVKTKSQLGKLSRRKGHQFERDIANKLKEIWPNARRHLENHEDDAKEGKDLLGTGDFKFQLKRLKRYAPINCIDELKVDRLLGDVPILITAGNNLEAMAVMPFDDLVWLLKKAGVGTSSH